MDNNRLRHWVPPVGGETMRPCVACEEQAYLDPHDLCSTCREELD